MNTKMPGMQHAALTLSCALLLFSLLLSGCVQHASVSGNWQEDATKEETFSNILVVGVGNDLHTRCELELFLENAIRATGTKAESSCILMTSKKPLTIENVEAVVADMGADAVLSAVVIHDKDGVMEGGKNDTRGGLDFKADGTGYGYFYGPRYGMYGVPVVYGHLQEAPVVTTISDEITVHTMLFATSDKRPVYEVTTHAKKLTSLDNALGVTTPPIVKQLQKKGLLSSQ